MIYQDTKGSIL